MDITEAIRARKSVRSYNGRGLDEGRRRRLQAAIDGAAQPFGTDFTIRLASFDIKGPCKPGTYGFVNGASDYLLLALNGADRSSVLGAGYAMERVLLEATAMGLGTCWIAGTFRGGDFDRGHAWPDGQVLTAISPVGEPSGRTSLLERVAHAALHSARRKPFDSMFFDGSFDNPLDAQGRFGTSLEMMRLAPSSLNKQPWRALVQNDTVHFYCTSPDARSLINIGIGLCHFAESERLLGHAGRFENMAGSAPAGKYHYVISYRDGSDA